MKNYISILLLGGFAACGGGGKAAGDAGAHDAAPADAAPADAAPADGAPTPDAPADTCNPLQPAGLQGCATGMKCTWIEVVSTPEPLGKLGCVPDGVVPLGAQCQRGAPGETTGYDDCVAGAICVGPTASGVCKDVCGFDGTAAAACDPGGACTRYDGLGANAGEDPVIGACNPTCDPLTQTRIVNGQTTDCGQGQGCYLLVSSVDTTAVCAGAGTVGHNEPIVGATYANSCAPGHVPRQAVQGQPGNECASLCKPADVYAGNNEAYEGGNTTVTNYANLPATCESAGGAAVRPDVPVTGESCQYYWTREPSSNLTAFSNTIGWCFNHASWKYDPDGMDPIDNSADYPRCITLTTGDVVPPVDLANPHNDALYFGCLALPAQFVASSKKKPAAPAVEKLDRLRSYKE